MKNSVTKKTNFRYWLDDPEDVCALTPSGAVSIWGRSMMQSEGKAGCPSHRAERQQDATLHIHAGSSVRTYEFGSCGIMSVVMQQCLSKQLLLHIVILQKRLGYLYLLWHQITKSQIHKTENPQCRAAWGTWLVRSGNSCCSSPPGNLPLCWRTG